MPSLTEMVSILNGERRLQDGEFDLEMDALASRLTKALRDRAGQLKS